MRVKVISILEDNYMYLVIEEQTKLALAVDPAVPHRLLEIVKEERVQKFTGKTDPVEVLKVLRKEKDKFKKPKESLPPHAMLALEWGLFGR